MEVDPSRESKEREYPGVSDAGKRILSKSLPKERMMIKTAGGLDIDTAVPVSDWYKAVEKEQGEET